MIMRAQYNLGVHYANGEGVLQDDAEAVRWYRLAAERPCCMDHPEGCLIIVFFNTGDNLDAT